MWGSILALCGRYPDELKGLKQGWWTDESQVETLCALAHWRQMLDDGGRDPVTSWTSSSTSLSSGAGSSRQAAE